jgi:hypothetical protein
LLVIAIWLLAVRYGERGDMLTRITKRTVDAVQANGADQFLWDRDLKGFGLKVTAAGNKVYILQYRKGGRGAPTKRVTIGRHGALTPEQARKEAARLSGGIANGADPAVIRAAEKSAPTVAAFTDRFLAEHVATKTKASTAVEYRRLIENYVLPAIGRKPMRDVTRADVSRLHHDHRTKPYAANRALAVMSKMFSLAEKWGERPDGSNPCRHVEKYAERKRERMLSADDFGRLADALRAPGRSPYVVAAVKLLGVYRRAAVRNPRPEMGMDRFRARRSAIARQQDRRQDTALSGSRPGRARRLAARRRQSFRDCGQRRGRSAGQSRKAVACHPGRGQLGRCSAA